MHTQLYETRDILFFIHTRVFKKMNVENEEKCRIVNEKKMKKRERVKI